MASVLDFYKNKVAKNINDPYDGANYASYNYLVNPEDFDALPQTREEPEEPNNLSLEEVDFENIEIIELTDDKIVIQCGGDWQNFTQFSASYNGGPKLTYNNDGKDLGEPTDDNEDLIDGMKNFQFFKKLYGGTIPPKMLPLVRQFKY